MVWNRWHSCADDPTGGYVGAAPVFGSIVTLAVTPVAKPLAALALAAAEPLATLALAAAAKPVTVAASAEPLAARFLHDPEYLHDQGLPADGGPSVQR